MIEDFKTELSTAILSIDNDKIIQARKLFRKASRIVFIGNGGSAAIASHMAIDYTKNAGKEAISFNDASALTCVANDYGYVNVFSKQIEWHCKPTDVLVAISSSGKSQNILNGVYAAQGLSMPIITLSGFEKYNPLSCEGSVNFYVPSMDYGVVEITHLSILHSLIGKLE